MTGFVDKLKEIWEVVAALALSYADKISHLPALLRDDPLTFTWVVGSLVVVVLLVVLLAVRGAATKQQHNEHLVNAPKSQPKAMAFIPVESSGAELDTVFLPLVERIATSRGGLSDDVRERILKLGPKALPDLVNAFPRCDTATRAQLSALVSEQRLLEAYSRRLLDSAEYPQGVLIDAWSCFPDDNVLRGFVELLASRDQNMQMAAVRLLSALKEPKSLSMLMLALVQPERYLPARVAEVFVAMPQQSSALLTYMLPEVDDKHKEPVLNIIAATGVSFDPTNVLPCLRHKNYRIRTAAVAALGAGHIESALPQLLLAALDKRWQVRAAAAKALGMLGNNRAVAVLEALSHDTEGWVAANANAALELFHSV